jgi:hypothetical protein
LANSPLIPRKSAQSPSRTNAPWSQNSREVTPHFRLIRTIDIPYRFDLESNSVIRIKPQMDIVNTPFHQTDALHYSARSPPPPAYPTGGLISQRRPQITFQSINKRTQPIIHTVHIPNIANKQYMQGFDRTRVSRIWVLWLWYDKATRHLILSLRPIGRSSNIDGPIVSPMRCSSPPLTQDRPSSPGSPVRIAMPVARGRLFLVLKNTPPALPQSPNLAVVCWCSVLPNSPVDSTDVNEST